MPLWVYTRTKERVSSKIFNRLKNKNMGGKKFISLKRKLFFSIGVPAFFLTILISVIVFFETENTFVEIKKEEQLQMTINESKVTENLFTMCRDVAQHIATLQGIIDVLNQPPTEPEKINELRSLLEKFNISGIFSSVYVLNISGDTLISTDTSFEGNNYSFRKYFQSAKDGQSGVDMAIGVTSKKPGFYFSSPVRSNQGEIIGVAVVKLDIKAIEDRLLDKQIGYANYMLIGEDGMILSSNVQERTFKNLYSKLLSSAEQSNIESQYKLSEIETLEYKDIFEEIRNAVSIKQLDIFDVLEGEHEVFSIVKIGSFPYYFVTEHYQDQITGLAIRPSVITIAIQIVGTTIAMLIAAFLITRFLRPINILQKTAKEISLGNFDQTLPFDTNDEIHQLGESLLDMATKLKDSYKNLNEEVQKKTAELQEKMTSVETMNGHMVGREIKMLELKKEISELKNELKKYEGRSNKTDNS